MCDYHTVFEFGNRCLKLHSADSDSTNMIKIISLSITNEAGTDNLFVFSLSSLWYAFELWPLIIHLLSSNLSLYILVQENRCVAYNNMSYGF